MNKQELEKIQEAVSLVCPFCGEESTSLNLLIPQIETYDQDGDKTYSANYNWICASCHADVSITIE